MRTNSIIEKRDAILGQLSMDETDWYEIREELSEELKHFHKQVDCQTAYFEPVCQYLLSLFDRLNLLTDANSFWSLISLINEDDFCEIAFSWKLERCECCDEPFLTLTPRRKRSTIQCQ